MWLAAVCVLLLVCGSCGKKGDPIPPEKPKSQSLVKFQALIPL